MKRKRKNSILFQLGVLFVAGAVIIGAVLFRELRSFFSDVVRSNQEEWSEAAAEDLKGYLDGYPARDWLFRFWYEHYDELEIEYDAPYSADTDTARKYSLLLERNPGFSPAYAGAEDVERLREEDQILYAEIMYSRLISRIDLLKQSGKLSYVLGVVSEEPYDRQMVLFISSRPGLDRGEEKGQVYPIGTELAVTEGRREAVRSAIAGEPRLSNNEDDKYVDYYYYIGSFDSHEVLISITANVLPMEEIIREQAGTLRMISIISLALLAAVFLLMIVFVAVRPLNALRKGIDLYKRTKDSSITAEALRKIRSDNEIEEISEDAARMAEELNKYMSLELQNAARQERTRTELTLASRIQQAMLPTVFPAYPDRTDFDIYASMTPAREVGGDFYDYFLVDDNHLCMLIADVSGKGVPAALYMMASKITLTYLIKSGKSPAQVLTEANAAICSKNPEEMFITVWLGILDLSTGKMICSNAGHEYPMMRMPGEDYKIIRDKHGFVIGGMEDMQYSEYELQMEPGASLFVYTDGLAEAVNPENEMFGTERMLSELNRDPDRAPEEILSGMKAAVGQYGEGTEAFDDLTMMAVTYHGPGKDS